MHGNGIVKVDIHRLADLPSLTGNIGDVYGLTGFVIVRTVRKRPGIDLCAVKGGRERIGFAGSDAVGTVFALGVN